MMSDLIERLRKRAAIRRQISTRKSVQEGKPDRIADLLDEAAKYIEVLENDHSDGEKGLIDGLHQALDRAEKAEEDVKSLRATNHRRLCGCAEGITLQCAIKCACRCHELEKDIKQLEELFNASQMDLQAANKDRFIGPCAHGRDPFDRCDMCVELTPSQAEVLAVKTEIFKNLSGSIRHAINILHETMNDGETYTVGQLKGNIMGEVRDILKKVLTGLIDTTSTKVVEPCLECGSTDVIQHYYHPPKPGEES